MTRRATGRGALEDRPAALGGGRERAVGLAVRALEIRVEARHVGGERVEVGADARLGIAERRVAPGRVKVGVRHQPEAAERAADVVLEVLHLVEVRAPVDRPEARAGVPEKIDGVAEALAAIGEVPGSQVRLAVEVAVRAGDVAGARDPGVRRVVEELLAAKHVGSERLARHDRQPRDLHR